MDGQDSSHGQRHQTGVVTMQLAPPPLGASGWVSSSFSRDVPSFCLLSHGRSIDFPPRLNLPSVSMLDALDRSGNTFEGHYAVVLLLLPTEVNELFDDRNDYPVSAR